MYVYAYCLCNVTECTMQLNSWFCGPDEGTFHAYAYITYTVKYSIIYIYKHMCIYAPTVFTVWLWTSIQMIQTKPELMLLNKIQCLSIIISWMEIG